MDRGSGILLHISSLDSKYGIGTLGKSAYDFIDSLESAGQKYWQILPISPTSYKDSPYQGLSAFAFNPYFIDLDMLAEDGLLRQADLDAFDFGITEDKVDYAKQFKYKNALLKTAYENGIKKYYKEFIGFVYENHYWIFDYSMFYAIKAYFDHKPIEKWDKEIKERHPDAMLKIANKLEKEIQQAQFEQFLFWKQWVQLKKYANEKNIKIIGDIPIYVSADSDVVWTKRDMFIQDGSVAGTPPDAFSKEGQVWGNPLYDWEYHKKTNYDWWIHRIYHCTQLFDYLRIDHFRGFQSYYEIPATKDATKGRWVKGPGADLFRAIDHAIGRPKIIAEDLGLLTDDIFSFMWECGYPGIKVLQFAFDEEDNIYLPHNYTKNCVVYTGTHDNDTIKGWYKSTTKTQQDYIKNYIGNYEDTDIPDKLIRLAEMSRGNICIIPMQDILEMDSDCRMNTPSVEDNNWVWRLKKGEFNKQVIKKLKQITKTYGR